MPDIDVSDQQVVTAPSILLVSARSTFYWSKPKATVGSARWRCKLLKISRVRRTVENCFTSGEITSRGQSWRRCHNGRYILRKEVLITSKTYKGERMKNLRKMAE